VPEIIDPVFAKTSPKRSFCMSENERFGLVFVKTGSINSGTDVYSVIFRLFRTPASVRKMSLFSCISSERSDVQLVNVQAVQNSCQREEDVPVQLYLQ
jgi:hypothetical protein